jgi:hypothetical protein
VRSALTAEPQPPVAATGVAVRDAACRIEKDPPHARTSVCTADLGLVQGASPLGGRVVSHLCKRPEEIDGGRARGGEHLLCLHEIRALERREREAVRGGDADRGRAADCERGDRVGHLDSGAAHELDLGVRQPALVEEDDPRGIALLQPDDVFRG